MYEYFKNTTKWTFMKTQFPVPTRPANKVEIMLFDAKRDIINWAGHFMTYYMRQVHKMRTGKEYGVQESEIYGFALLGIAALFIVLFIYKFFQISCYLCCRKKAKTEDKETNEKKE